MSSTLHVSGQADAPAAGALPLAWKGLVAISGGTAEATNGFVDETAGHRERGFVFFFK